MKPLRRPFEAYIDNRYLDLRYLDHRYVDNNNIKLNIGRDPQHCRTSATLNIALPSAPITVLANNPPTQTTAIKAIFQHWQAVMQHPHARLDVKRQKAIGRALKTGYSSAQLCQAITGCSQTPHNMGDNDRGQRYDGLQLILRDADQIDRFIRNGQDPPQPLTASQKRTHGNLAAVQHWLSDMQQNQGGIDYASN